MQIYSNDYWQLFRFDQHHTFLSTATTTTGIGTGEMTKITQINDRSAATAWSPVAEYAGVIALGAKVSDDESDD
ncbi:MAG: hypothetical protein ACI8RD_000766 [Bacillariaceae sp.]